MARAFDTYKYEFKVDGQVVIRGVTNDLKRRESEHRFRWPNGRIVKVGRMTTRASALAWMREQNARHHQVAPGSRSPVGTTESTGC